MHSMAVQQVHTGVELYDFYHLRNKKKTFKIIFKILSRVASFIQFNNPINNLEIDGIKAKPYILQKSLPQ